MTRHTLRSYADRDAPAVQTSRALLYVLSGIAQALLATMMTIEQMNAATVLFEALDGAGRDVSEGEARLWTCESCKGDLFDVAIEYLMACRVVRPTLMAFGRLHTVGYVVD